MRDTLKTAMMTPEVGTETLPTSSEEPAWETEPVPISGIKVRRGDRSQREVAREAGISQGFLSELEGGRKRLTLDTAQKLASVLGTTPDHLMLCEHLTKLNRAATQGNVNSQRLLDEAKRLTEILPGGEVGDAIVDALVGIVRERAKSLT